MLLVVNDSIHKNAEYPIAADLFCHFLMLLCIDACQDMHFNNLQMHTAKVLVHPDISIHSVYLPANCLFSSCIVFVANVEACWHKPQHKNMKLFIPLTVAVLVQL